MKAASDGVKVHAIFGARKALTIEGNTNTSMQALVFWQQKHLTEEFLPIYKRYFNKCDLLLILFGVVTAQG